MRQLRISCQRLSVHLYETLATALMTCARGFVQITRGSALLGYVPVANVGLVLLATRIRDVLTLPGGHVVKLVVESKWFTVPLQVQLARSLRPCEAACSATTHKRVCQRCLTCHTRTSCWSITAMGLQWMPFTAFSPSQRPDVEG